MKILIETPSWLGDSVMLTPALQNIKIQNPKAKIILVGSKVAIEILKGFGDEYYILERKNRFANLKKVANKIGKVDLSISFRTSFFSGVLQILSKAKVRIARQSFANRLFINQPVKVSKNSHQVEKYLELLNFDEVQKFDLKLNFEPKKFEQPTLGINAGATYGSAKRWYPEKFAEVIKVLSKKYSVILFGGAGEIEINSDIEQMADIKLQNLAGKTSIQELAENIAGLSLFITNDSGPMHIAGAFKIPTVAIFGSTNHIETNQWKNSRQEIVRKNIECSPCMKRECPLKHHDCMKNISASDVLNAVEKLFEDKR